MKIQKGKIFQKSRWFLNPEIIISVLLFINCFVGAYFYSVTSYTIDFFTWWAVPHSISKGYIKVPYPDDSRKKMAESIKLEIETTKNPNVEKRTFDDVLKYYEGRITATASPFFYTVFRFFVGDDYAKDKRKFIFFSVACFAASIFILGRLLKFSYLFICIFYALLSFWNASYNSEVRVGNVNQIQLVLITLFIFFFTKAKTIYHFFWIGFYLGCVVLFKPNLCFFIFFTFIFSLFHRHIKNTLAFLLGAALSSVFVLYQTYSFFKLPFFYEWRSWIESCYATMSGFFSVSLGNYSLPKMISLQFGVDVSLYIFALLIGLFIWVVLTYNRPFQSPFSKTLEPVNEENSKVDAFFIASFASLTMLLGSKLVWSHYHLMTLPVFLYLMRPQIESGYILKSQAFIKFCTFIAFAFTTQLFVEIFPGQQACALKINIVAFVLVLLFILDLKPHLFEKFKRR